MGLLGSCHCGRTRFEVDAAPATLTRCTCSSCSKRGALWAYYTPDSFRLLTPADDVATYRWNTKMVKLNFCATCGCATFNESPDWSSGEPDFEHPKVSVNARLFDGFNLDAVPVETIDGRNLW
ncbi:GFA family protein [Marilutibacter chinensis]|uniref:GFA family protein n=1 Tax=Marilutibacter chinensis TaxID=2912247 RepID=A0ABS9HSD5_9GAMM|nr:GFA family protein [Lysobacter chinensis]MCF7221426.1 GFA family protein [Lysobacter chinensis]